MLCVATGTDGTYWRTLPDFLGPVFTAAFGNFVNNTASLWMTHPHGDGQAAVDVSFLKPALLHDASSLRAQ